MLPKSQCIWKIIVNVDHIYPYPNITCIFDGGVRVADISKSTENITDLKDGTFSYNMKANITVSSISWPFCSFPTSLPFIPSAKFNKHMYMTLIYSIFGKISKLG